MHHTVKLKRSLALLGTLLFLLLSGMGYLMWIDHNGTAIVHTSDSIDSIKLLRPGFPELVMSKTNEQWQLTAPCTASINQLRLQPLLEALQPAQHQYQATEVDLEAAGLTRPLATVYLNERKIELGGTDLRGDRRYALSNNVVEFAPEWVLSLINGGATAFAKLEPFGAELSQLSLNGEVYDDESKLEAWRNLSAQQIVEWSTLTLTNSEQVWQLQAIIDGRQHQFEVHSQSDFIALRTENAACAYVFSPDSLPAQ